MQMNEARELKKLRGNLPCDHPELEKQYYLRMSTGDYVCTRCGEAGWGSDWNQKPVPLRDRRRMRVKPCNNSFPLVKAMDNANCQL
jgi:hypothetical protein